MSSNSSLKPSTIALGVTAALATGAVGYCVYFDYQRRHNPSFRKALDRERLKVAKAAKADAQRQRTASADSLRRAMAQVANEPMPGGSAEEKEQYFLEQVAMGEQLVARGPEFYIPAAVQFFKALRVYPAPHELIMIYQKTQPPQVFSLIMECLSSEGAPRARTASGSSLPSDGGAIIEEIPDGASSRGPSSPRRVKKTSSQTGSDASSPNGAGSYVEVATPASVDG